MFILKYPTYDDKLADILSAMTNVNDANLINIAAVDSRTWVSNNTGKGGNTMGHVPRGDNAPAAWAAAIINKSFNSQIPWNAIIPWFAAGFGAANQSTNTCVNVSAITLQLYDYSISAWRKVDTGGNPTWCIGQNYSNNTLVTYGPVTKRVESDGSWSITINPAQGVAHGGTDKVHIPSTIADYTNLRGIFIKIRASLALIDTGGVDDRHLAQILVAVGADAYPETTIALNPDFAGIGYAPACGKSRWVFVDSNPRDYYMATLNPPAAPSTVSDYVIANGAGSTTMPTATFEAKLPPYIP